MIKNLIFMYIDIDDFCILKDKGLEDEIISYSEYFKIRNIKIIRNKNNKIVIKKNKKEISLYHILTAEYATLFIYIVNNYLKEFPLNILIDCNWPKKKINLAFKSKNIYYLFDSGNKIIKINSIKSAINKYNYPAILNLLYAGIKPTDMDLKVAKFINIKQITDAINYFY